VARSNPDGCKSVFWQAEGTRRSEDGEGERVEGGGWRVEGGGWRVEEGEGEGEGEGERVEDLVDA